MEEFIYRLDPDLVLRARGDGNDVALRRKVKALVNTLYPDQSAAEKDQLQTNLLRMCLYRVKIAQDTAGTSYMDPTLALLGSKEFLPAEFVSRFIDTAVATIFLRPRLHKLLSSSKGQGLSREAVQVEVRKYRQQHQLVTLADLRAFASKMAAEQGLDEADAVPADQREELLSRIAQAEQMLTVPALAGLEKDEQGLSPRRQVNALVGSMPSFYVPNAFAADTKRLPAQRSNVAVVYYAHDWSQRGLDAGTMMKRLAAPQMFSLTAETLAEAAGELRELQDALEVARETLKERVGGGLFDDWAADNERLPLTIYAVVLNTNPNSWPKPARGDLGRGAELRSVAGAEKNGKLVLFQGASLVAPSGKRPEVVVTPAALSEREVNLIFRNYMPFAVTEVDPGEFKFVSENKADLALAPEVLVHNERVQQTVEAMAEAAEERAAKKKSKAEEKKARRNPQPQTADSPSGLLGLRRVVGGKTQEAREPQGQAPAQKAQVEISDIEWLAISSYLHDIAPAEKRYSRTPQEIARRKAGAALTGASVVGARRTESRDFTATRYMSKLEVAARLRAQASGWWPNLTRIVLDNNSDPVVFTEVSSEAAKEAMLARALQLYGVDAAAQHSPAHQLRALTELRNRLLLDEPPTALEREAYVPARLRAASKARDAQSDDDEDTISDEDAISETLIAQLNPRRRAPRAPRRPRLARPSLRRNPLSSDYASKVKSVFSQTDEFVPESPEEEVDYTVTRRAFPDVFSTRGDAKPEAAAARIAEHGQYVRFGRRPVLDDYEFGTVPPSAQGGLSGEEARAIHKRQVEAYDRRAKSSIPASSALCAVNRRQKLKGYRPPSVLMRFGEPGFAEKKVVIWVSPASAAETRVMMYRRNTHIDCDFVASMGGMSLGQLLALALQDVLLWLAQRDARKLDTYVYVGRVGDATMRLAWKPGNPLTYSAMLKNLGGNGETLSGYDAQDDVDRYKRAAQISYVAAVDATQRAAQTVDEEEEDDEDLPPAAPPPTSSPTPPLPASEAPQGTDEGEGDDDDLPLDVSPPMARPAEPPRAVREATQAEKPAQTRRRSGGKPGEGKSPSTDGGQPPKGGRGKKFGGLLS